jgi:hypothetical protein
MPAGRGRTVLSAQQQLVGPTPEVKIGVAPAVEFTGTSEGLARSACVGVFAGVMNQQDGLELLDGVRQTLAVGWRVKPQAGCSNYLDRKGIHDFLAGLGSRLKTSKKSF